MLIARYHDVVVIELDRQALKAEETSRIASLLVCASERQFFFTSFENDSLSSRSQWNSCHVHRLAGSLAYFWGRGEHLPFFDLYSCDKALTEGSVSVITGTVLPAQWLVDW
jgi:hypothetical protein